MIVKTRPISGKRSAWLDQSRCNAMASGLEIRSMNVSQNWVSTRRISCCGSSVVPMNDWNAADAVSMTAAKSSSFELK